MHKSIIAIAAALALALGLSACGQSNNSGSTNGQTAGEQTQSTFNQAGESASNAVNTATTAVTDSAITAAVKSKLLANSSTDGLDINVETDNGVVTLSGSVDSGVVKDMAGRIASNTKGVKDVNNNLEVSSG